MPPNIVIPDKLFVAVDTPSEAEVERGCAPWVYGQLHPFLNQLPCLRDLQRVRLRWKSRTGSHDAFGTFRAYPRHWCSFNHGGRAEAQLNVGLFPEYFRVGLGFEFTEKLGGDPSAVTLAYALFRNITTDSAEYARFVRSQQIEVEYLPTSEGRLGHDSTETVVGWEPPAFPPIQWIFFGRLLRRGIDQHVLEDSQKLGAVLNDVLCGFKPFWAQAQEQAARMK
jgi:hypothetical protein